MATETKVTVKRTPGPVRHEIGDYVWEEANGFVQDVDVETAAQLITSPKAVFTLAGKPTPAGLKALADALGVEQRNIVWGDAAAAPETPPVTISQIVGGKRAMELAALGMTDARQLAGLSDEGIEALAVASGASRSEVRAWAKQAKADEVKNGK